MDFVFSGLKLILCHIQVSMLKSKSVLLNQFDWSLPSVRSSIICYYPYLLIPKESKRQAPIAKKDKKIWMQVKMSLSETRVEMKVKE